MRYAAARWFRTSVCPRLLISQKQSTHRLFRLAMLCRTFSVVRFTLMSAKRKRDQGSHDQDNEDQDSECISYAVYLLYEDERP